MQTQGHLPVHDPAPQPGRQTLVRPTLETVLAAVPGSRPADPPGPSRYHQIVATTTLALAVWFVFSPMILGYPLDPVGHTAIAWSETIGFIVLVTSAARAYQPAVTRTAAVVLLAGSLALVVMAVLSGFRSSAPVVWWDFLATGAGLTILSLLGLVLVLRERRHGHRREDRRAHRH
jgi:hypothetical protein